MNRDAIQARCESRFGDTANAVITDAEWASYINDAYLDVCSAAVSWEPPAPFLEARASNTVTSGGEITLPSDCWRVTAVFNDTDNFLLERLDGRSGYREFYPDPANNRGTPTSYRLRANVLELYPRPSSSTDVVVDYFVNPAELGASDEPVFAEQYHRILVAGALAFAYEDEGDERRAEVQRQRFANGLEAMRLDMTASRGATYTALVDDWG